MYLMYLDHSFFGQVAQNVTKDNSYNCMHFVLMYLDHSSDKFNSILNANSNSSLNFLNQIQGCPEPGVCHDLFIFILIKTL